jgi:hypothetical protein
LEQLSAFPTTAKPIPGNEAAEWQSLDGFKISDQLSNNAEEGKATGAGELISRLPKQKVVGATGFEPATSWSQTKCSSQAELRSDSAA